MLPVQIDLKKDTLCDIIRRWADIQPDAPALLHVDKAPFSYSALVNLMDEIRAALNASGFGRGDRIGIIHAGGGDMMGVMLGVMSGATAAPLNPNFSETELAFHFTNSRIDAVIIDGSLESPAPRVAQQLGIPWLELRKREGPDEDGVFIEVLPGAAPKPTAKSVHSDLAMVLSTSGTTSIGKVVPLGWLENLTRFQNNAERFGLGSEDCCFILRPLYYVSAVSNCMAALYAGGKALIVPRFNADQFFQCLVPHGVTWFACGPAFLRAMHERIPHYKDAVSEARLRFIRSGTSRLDPEFADSLEKALGVPIIESYGSTETGRLTCNPLPPGERKRGTVGTIHSRDVAIMDADGTLLGPGAFGEIVARGDQIFTGYENDDDANTAAFIDGWFHTGDIGVFDEDGYLTLAGRIKEMINRGGEKVSPAEVDAALMAHPQVREAAAFPIPHPTLGEEVAAAIVRTENGTVSEKELTRFLLERLVGFKVPRRYVFVDDIPKGETGKVQRYKLAEILGVEDIAAPAAGGAPERDPSPLEAELQSIWAKILKRDRIGLDDNFFLLGGDSLQAVDLFLEIERSLKRRLPIAALFEAGTVAEMAALIEKEEAQGCMVPIQPEGARPPFFCVHGNGGQVIGFYNMARRLGGDQPFYGIQSVGWDGKIVPFTSTQKMAAHYVAEMRKIQPHGPYILGGYSFGGRIAVFMANLLKAAGEEVALLALLDTSSHIGRAYVALPQWLELHGSPTGAKRAGESLRYLWFRTRKTYDHAYQHLRRAVLFPLWHFYRRTGKPLPQFLRDPRRANRLLRLEHRNMPSYDGDAVYFKARPMPGSAEHADARGAWKRLIKGRLEVIDVPGYHDEIIKEPFVETLARELDRKITECLSRQSSAAAE